MGTEPEDPKLRLAGEQNLLAWVRTGLSLMGFGFVVAKFGLFLQQIAVVEHIPKPKTSETSLWMGVLLILLGVITNIVAAIEHYLFLRRIARGEAYRPPHFPTSIVIAVLLALVGLVMAVLLTYPSV